MGKEKKRKENLINKIEPVILENIKTGEIAYFKNKLLLHEYFIKNIFNSKNVMCRINRLLKKELTSYKGYKIYYETEIVKKN